MIRFTMKKTFFLFALVVLFLSSCNDRTRKSYWDNGNLKSELSYDGDVLNGTCTWYYENGRKQFQVDYQNNKMNGKMTRWYENGNIMEDGFYKDGELDSIYHSYSLKGILASEEHYSDGKLNGPIVKWYENGQVFTEGQFVDGMMDGSWMMFYSDGALASTANYVMGTGQQIGYEMSGYKCLVTNYVDNQKHGLETYYNPDGTVAKTTVYEYGEEVETTFHGGE